MALRFIIGFMLTANTILAQGGEALDKRNGFKDIKMVSLVTAYDGLEFSKAIEDEEFPDANLYTAKKGHYENIGSLKIYNLEVKVYKDSIFEIRVITEKDPKLYKGLKKAFGTPEFAYRSGKYYWKSKRLMLTYSSYSSNKIEMVYRSFVMKGKLKADKEEEVNDIVSDF